MLSKILFHVLTVVERALNACFMFCCSCFPPICKCYILYIEYGKRRPFTGNTRVAKLKPRILCEKFYFNFYILLNIACSRHKEII